MYTFMTEESYESKKVKGIGKNVVDDGLKYEDYKNGSFNKSYMIQSKTDNIVKFLCLLRITKNIYLNMDIVGYYSFINLLLT